MSRFTGDKAKLGYHTHYVVDGGKARIILAALVTPASIMDSLPMLDLVRRVRFHWRLHPKIGVGDSKYGTVDNIVGLEQGGIKAYLPTPDLSQRSGFFPPEVFEYEPAQNLYRCPQGHELPLFSRRTREEVLVYRANAATCNACPLKAQCTNSQSGRHIFRSFYQEYLDRIGTYRATEAYQKALRKRQVWVEPLFGEGKHWHQMPDSVCEVRLGYSAPRLRTDDSLTLPGWLTCQAPAKIKAIPAASIHWRRSLKKSAPMTRAKAGVKKVKVFRRVNSACASSANQSP